MCIWTELFYINLFVWIFMVKKNLELGFFGDAIINFIVFEKKDFYRHYFEFVFATRRFSTFQLNWNTNTCRGPCDRVLNTLIYLFISSWLIWCCLLLLAFSNRFICGRRIHISSLKDSGILMMIIKIWEWRWPATRKMIQNWINRVIAVVDFTHETLRCPNNGYSSSLNEV